MEHIELQGLSIVLLGSFNPAIFSPDWLLAQAVISVDEAAAAQVEVIHPEIAQFQVGDLSFEITQERFALHVIAEPFVRGADIVVDLFGDKLAHTPTTAIGINYLAHFRVRDWKMQKALGRALAPIVPWGEWGRSLEGNGTPAQSGGLLNLTMQQQTPDDRKAGNIRVTVQPSVRLVPLGTGVFMQVNDHYEKSGDSQLNIPDLCAQMITPSLERSRRIVSSLSEHAWSL